MFDTGKILDRISDAVLSINVDLEVEYFNAPAKSIIDELRLNTNIVNIRGPLGETIVGAMQNLSMIARKEVYCRRSNVWRAVDVYNTDSGTTVVIRDITKQKLKEDLLAKEALKDSLTGLANRRAVEKHVENLLTTGSRTVAQSLFFIDLDGFKKINDTFGHDAGDFALVEIAKRLRKVPRANDMVARISGDEFIVVAECANGSFSATKLAQKLLASVTKPIVLPSGDTVQVGASIGIALFSLFSDTKETVFKKADMAMYCVKNSSKNNYLFYEEIIGNKAPSIFGNVKLPNV